MQYFVPFCAPRLSTLRACGESFLFSAFCFPKSCVPIFLPRPGREKREKRDEGGKKSKSANNGGGRRGKGSDRGGGSVDTGKSQERREGCKKGDIID